MRTARNGMRSGAVEAKTVPPLFFGSLINEAETAAQACAIRDLWLRELAQAGRAYAINGWWHHEVVVELRRAYAQCLRLRVWQ